RATVSWCASASSLPKRTLPSYASASASTCGDIARHGAHQAAQKSISTGRGERVTSRSKLSSVISTTLDSFLVSRAAASAFMVLPLSSGDLALGALAFVLHAGAQVGLGAVEQHGDVARPEAELARDVLARPIVEHAQRDDGALNVGEPGHAPL